MRFRNLAIAASIGARLARFSIVGIAATVTYFLVANLIIVTGIVSPTRASVVAYCAGMAVSYVGQSRFTFRVTSHSWSQMIRYGVMSIGGLLFSWWSVWLAVEKLHVHSFWGTLVTAASIPLLSFIVMNSWVFSKGGRRSDL